MKNVFLFLVLIICTQVAWTQVNAVIIKGKVTDGTYPLGNVNIKIEDKNKGTKTDSSGNYLLRASIGDLIEYSYLGYAPVQIIIEDVTEVLNLKMTRVTQQLKEVVVKKRNKKTYIQKLLDYESNTDLIKTAYGFLDKRKSSMALNIIDESEFLPGALTFAEAIQGKFNGRITYPKGSRFIGVVVYLRERPNLLSGPQPAIFDLDGVITDADAALAIPASEIKRIAILRGLGASSRYGNRANGGVIVINTKTGIIKPKIDGIQVKDLQAAQAEFTNENICEPSSEIAQANQLKKLWAAESEASAIAIFNKEKVLFENSPYVLIDAGNYFNTRWKNIEKAKEIWEGVKVKFSDNSNVLKVVAYYFEQAGSLKVALDIYQKISALRPKYAQTYRDLANMHNQLDNPKQALNVYTQYLKAEKGNSSEFLSDGIDLVLHVEALDILSKEKMKKPAVLQDFELPFKNSPTRILLEWNNGETEFDIQMIRQDKSSLIWKHSYLENPAQITQEKKLGYSTKQFFIDKNDIGKWVFNIKYLGNKSANPSYLKATVQYDYGTKSQKEMIQVLRLPEKENCLQLFSI